MPPHSSFRLCHRRRRSAESVSEVRILPGIELPPWGQNAGVHVHQRLLPAPGDALPRPDGRPRARLQVPASFPDPSLISFALEEFFD